MATTSDEYTPLSLDVQRALLKKFEETEIDPFGEDGEVGRYLRTIIDGDPGCGKTYLAALLGKRDALENGRKTLFLDAENSTEIFKGKDEFKDIIKVRPFPGVSELTYLLPRIAAKGVFGTVVVESFTTASDSERKQIMINEGFKRAHKEASTLEDYGLLLNRWAWLFDVAVKTPINFIVNCHVEDPDSREIQLGLKRRPFATDKQAKAMMTRLGSILFMEEIEENGKRARIIQTRSSNRILAKTRIDELPDQVNASKFVKMVDNWRRGLPVDSPTK
jgi:hypothetical protein